VTGEEHEGDDADATGEEVDEDGGIGWEAFATEECIGRAEGCCACIVRVMCERRGEAEMMARAADRAACEATTLMPGRPPIWNIARTRGTIDRRQRRWTKGRWCARANRLRTHMTGTREHGRRGLVTNDGRCTPPADRVIAPSHRSTRIIISPVAHSERSSAPDAMRCDAMRCNVSLAAEPEKSRDSAAV
jgi:hypothetical protein